MKKVGDPALYRVVRDPLSSDEALVASCFGQKQAQLVADVLSQVGVPVVIVPPGETHVSLGALRSQIDHHLGVAVEHIARALPLLLASEEVYHDKNVRPTIHRAQRDLAQIIHYLEGGEIEYRNLPL